MTDEPKDNHPPEKDEHESYYYDDSHGYEDFDPETDEENETEKEPPCE